MTYKMLGSFTLLVVPLAVGCAGRLEEKPALVLGADSTPTSAPEPVAAPIDWISQCDIGVRGNPTLKKEFFQVNYNKSATVVTLQIEAGINGTSLPVEMNISQPEEDHSIRDWPKLVAFKVGDVYTLTIKDWDKDKIQGKMTGPSTVFNWKVLDANTSKITTTPSVKIVPISVSQSHMIVEYLKKSVTFELASP